MSGISVCIKQRPPTRLARRHPYRTFGQLVLTHRRFHQHDLNFHPPLSDKHIIAKHWSTCRRSWMFLKCATHRAFQALNGKIVECALDVNKADPRMSRWRFMRVREDKSHPNSYMTYQGVLKSILYVRSMWSYRMHKEDSISTVACGRIVERT